MEKDGVQIGFGIMGGWTQAQAHAQFVDNIADYGFDIQEALDIGDQIFVLSGSPARVVCALRTKDQDMKKAREQIEEHLLL